MNAIYESVNRVKNAQNTACEKLAERQHSCRRKYNSSELNRIFANVYAPCKRNICSVSVENMVHVIKIYVPNV